MSIHEDDNLWDARLSALLRLFYPPSWTDSISDFHEFDVVITGDNPVLASVLSSAAINMGLTIAVTFPSLDDEWPYDLVSSRVGDSVVHAVFPWLSREVGVPLVRTLIRQTIKSSPRIVSLGSVNFRLSLKNPKGEIGLYLQPVSPKTKFENRELDGIASIFRSEVSRLPAAQLRTDGKTVCFAKKLILTARMPILTRTSLSHIDLGHQIAWSDDDRIRSVGTAAIGSKDGESMAKMMLEDMISCSRAIPLSANDPVA